jgi:uncharacterized membrane protein YdfJ with MMPL/SSD domain
MFLFDKANWWTPRWLDHTLPHLEPDTAAVTVTPAGKAQPVPELAA